MLNNLFLHSFLIRLQLSTLETNQVGEDLPDVDLEELKQAKADAEEAWAAARKAGQLRPSS